MNQVYEENVQARAVTSNFRTSSDFLFCAITLLLLLFCAALSLYRQTPPAAVPATAPATEFSSGRAMKELQVLAAKPHPMGSLEHSAVRDYLLNELASAGLKPEVQQATGANRVWEDYIRAGTVHNVLARLPGTANSKAILLTAHYDSMPNAAGASDDGAAVVSLLETMRNLKAGAPLKNDVIFLFTDGEEAGLLGSSAFVEDHPWAKQVGLVLNFEARGNSGPAIMYETSERNGWLISEFAKAAPHPVAHSLAYEVYKRLPNDTDLTVFRKAGMPGLNFAYIDGLTRYHTQLDNLSNIDERSLQHEGSYALALTRHFGNLDLNNTSGANAVYFDILGLTLIDYSTVWVLPLTVFVCLLFLLTILYGLRRRSLTLAGTGLGALAFLLTAIVAVGATMLVWTIAGMLQSPEVKPEGVTYNGGLYLMSFVAFTVALVSVLYIWFRKRLSNENLTAGGLFWLLVLSVATALYVQGASYLFTWPLLFSLIGLCLMLRKKEGASRSLAMNALLLLCAVPGLILLTPVIYQLFSALTLSSIGVVTLLLVLLLGLLIPHLGHMSAPNKWLLPGAALAVSLIFVVAGLMSSGAAPSRPKLDSILYAFDADSGKAVWATLDKQPDEWTSQLLTSGAKFQPLKEFFSSSTTGQLLQQEAPASASLRAPELTMLDDKTGDGVRTVHMHISSPRAASVVSVYLDSKAEVVGATVNGKRIDNTPAAVKHTHHWMMRYYAIPPEGIDLTAQIKTGEPLKMRVVDQSYGLPQIDGVALRPRPDYIIPAPISLTDSTLVSKSFTF